MSLAINFPQDEIPGVPFRLKEERPSPVVPPLHNIMGGNVAKTQHVWPPDVSFPLPSFLHAALLPLAPPRRCLPPPWWACRSAAPCANGLEEGASERAGGDDVSRANGRRGGACRPSSRAPYSSQKEACLICCSKNIVFQIMIRYG